MLVVYKHFLDLKISADFDFFVCYFFFKGEIIEKISRLKMTIVYWSSKLEGNARAQEAGHMKSQSLS